MPILDSFEYHEKCEDCPLECDSVSFIRISEKILLAGDRFYSDKFKKTLNMSQKFSNFTLDYLLSNLIVINLQFEKIQYMEIKEVAKMSVASLIGELGGTLGKINVFCCRYIYLFNNHFQPQKGVFSGLSFVSFVEILEMILEIIMLNIK